MQFQGTTSTPALAFLHEAILSCAKAHSVNEFWRTAMRHSRWILPVIEAWAYEHGSEGWTCVAQFGGGRCEGHEPKLGCPSFVATLARGRLEWCPCNEYEGGLLFVPLGVKEEVRAWIVFRMRAFRDDERNSIEQVATLYGLNLGGLLGLLANNEALTEARAQAEAAASATSAFLANMSHELRTPLNGVVGMAELLLRSNGVAEQRECARAIVASATSLQEIVNDILDYSKIEAGHFELDPQECDLLEMFEDLAFVTANTAADKGIGFCFAYDPHAPRVVTADRGRIRQVVTNLLSNAIKFTVDGQVTLRVDRIGGERGPMLLISVGDTGIGMSLEEQEHVFDRFRQAKVSTTRRFGGTGLGLAISQRIVEMMDSELVLQSRVGEGSIFAFSLDVPGKPVQHPTALRGQRLLVVGTVHDPCLLELLELWGIEVETCPDWDSAATSLQLAAAEGRAFDRMLVGDEALLRELDSLPEAAPCCIALVSVAHSNAFSAPGLTVLPTPLRRSALERALGGDCCAEELVAEDAAARESLCVLLVDDQEVNRRLARRVLEKLGHRVTVACDGQEALEVFESSAGFDAILMDCQMPRLDGFAATRRIRRLERERSLEAVPIIALTAHAMAGDQERCFAAGMTGYVSKPFRFDDLAKELAKIPRSSS